MQDGDEPNKLFVGGLSWETTKESMYETFIKFGQITECNVMMNSEVPPRSRGFGFVTFQDAASVTLALDSKPHIVDGRQVDAKLCNKKAAAAARQANKQNKVDNKDKKIFVGGLPLNITEERCKEFFNQYGNVTDVVIMYDTVKQRPRGFGFIGFDNEETVCKMCDLHFVSFDGKQVECKQAKPRIPGMGTCGENQNPNAWAVAAITQQYTNPGSFQQQQEQTNSYGYGQDGTVNNYGIDLSSYGYGYNPQQNYPAAPQPAGTQAPYNPAYQQPAFPQQPAYGAPQAPYGNQPAPQGQYNMQQAPVAPSSFDYNQANMGQNYGQQQSHYGPDRTGYAAGPPQQHYGGYGGAGGGGGSFPGNEPPPGGYPNPGPPAGPAAPGGYTGGDQNFNAPGGGATQGYHPYRR